MPIRIVPRRAPRCTGAAAARTGALAAGLAAGLAAAGDLAPPKMPKRPPPAGCQAAMQVTYGRAKTHIYYNIYTYTQQAVTSNNAGCKKEEQRLV